MTGTHGNQKVSDQELIEALRRSEHPVASASEIAAELQMTRTGVNERLKQLLREGRVRKKSVGTGYVWWVVDES